MLHLKELSAKTYEELLAESLEKIPVYSKEWTNYNPADPGITILENLTALQVIQQSRIDEVPPTLGVRLLELLGYQLKSERSAEVYLEAAGVREAFSLSANQRFMAGDISFETALPGRVGAGRIVGVFRQTADTLTDCSYILDREMTLRMQVFGDGAAKDASLWLVMDEPPQEGEEKILYVEVAGSEGRTPFSDETDITFAEICWECYTADGFVSMQAKDGTHGFLADGYLRLTQPEGHRAVRMEAGGISGYVWRARLLDSAYDVPPVVTYVSGFLFPVYQKETLAAVDTFQDAANVVIDGALSENGYIRVYAKEEKDASYRAYEESMGDGARGRYYRKEKLADGNYALIFDRERFGHAPGRFRNAVKIVSYSEEMMRHYDLGKVFGYDGQTIRLPKAHVVRATFCVIAERVARSGETIYDFLRPERQGGQELCYFLKENEGELVIRHPGKYVGARLYLGAIAVTRGPEGNVRAGNTFVPVKPVCGGEICFRNPGPGRGGAFQESFEGMRRRFAGELGRAETAVTPSDYEALVKRLPGVCIDKVHAWMDEEKNEVQVAVLPQSGEAFPQLSQKYLEEIGRWLDDRRLLATGIRIRQPVYAAVSVNGTIYVKPHYDGCREKIEAALLAGLDYVHGSMDFGERLCFDKIFRKVEELDCVAYIQKLAARAQNTANVSADGLDIVPGPDCLLYPGKIMLDILPQSGGR